MAEQDAAPLPAPPPLPPKLTDPVPVVVVGTALWFLAAVVVLLFGGAQIVVWTCLAGGVLGIIGYGIFRWQRSAARRGSRTAQSGLE
ncbi:MAG: DUF2530 domain-containing protein [Saccharothrix sp.]|nr:DUF2530 domain-containing protein [Saccharothrix sp.]